MKNKQINPCDQPCSKCGSLDIYRIWQGVGEEVNLPIGCLRKTKEQPPFTIRKWPEGLRVAKEHLYNYCRSCQYAWLSDVLKPS